MGEVYRARDTKLDRDVAIKVLPDRSRAMASGSHVLQREAQTLASLNHPHIAAIYGLEESGGIGALVMELVEGEDLVAADRSWPDAARRCAPDRQPACEGLEAAHERGIIHRDLKPANIKVRPTAR